MTLDESSREREPHVGQDAMVRLSRCVDPRWAIRRTQIWFEQRNGWAPPDETMLDEWLSDSVYRCPDDCLVGPTGYCVHGLASW